MTIHNINNLEIVANHKVNATTNDENADTEPANTENINTTDIESDNNDDIAKSDNNDDNLIMSDKDSPLESPAEDNEENDDEGENGTEEVPSPLIYGRKTNDPMKVKSSKRCRPSRPIKVTPLEESPTGHPQKGKDKEATDPLNTFVFNPNDVPIHSFFLEGEPEGKLLEGIEEEKLLEIHRAFQEKLKERDAEQEKNITKKIQEYEQKYDYKQSLIRKCGTDHRNDQA